MNPIVQNRLQFYINKKAALLKMKKSERNGELPLVEDTIQRLKRWNRELNLNH